MHDTKQNQRYEIKFVTLNTNYALIKNWLKLNNYNFKKQYNDRIFILIHTILTPLKKIYLEIHQE